jgi:hypothetical protein
MSRLKPPRQNKSFDTETAGHSRLLFADVPRAKAELSKHCTAITFTPEGSTFRISGDWNWLGVQMVPGPRIEHSSPRIEFQIEIAT